MKQLTSRSISTAKFASVTAALVMSALFAGNQAHADIYEFYVAESAVSGQATNLLDYTFDSTLGTATLVNTYSTGIFGAKATGTNNSGALQLSGDGKSLTYAGFASPGSGSNEALFNLATKTFDTTTLPSINVRSSWTQNGTSFFLAGGTSSTTPAIINLGGTTATTIVSNPVLSSNNIIVNNNTVYSTRNSTATGVYAAANAASISSAVPFTVLTGTGLLSGTGSSDTYNGIGFLGNDTMFLADTLTNTLSAFHDASYSSTPFANWNLTFSLSLSSTAPIEQLSVVQTDANNAFVFFTTSSGTLTSVSNLSTFNEVSYNTSTGWGSINNLGSSSTQFFSGIAVVPEPSTYALLALGLGLVAWMSIRRKAGQRQS